MPLPSKCCQELDGLAREILTTFDRIVHYLMTAVIAEGMDDDLALTLQEVRIFKMVSFREPVRMQELAKAARISLPAATHLVDSLVAKGIVVRTRTDEDRRLVLVSRSKRAKAREQRCFDDRVEMILGVLRELVPAERAKFAKATGEIARVLDPARAPLPQAPRKRQRATTRNKPKPPVEHEAG
jgi:DNA-binding MarR family transcriptional regulator